MKIGTPFFVSKRAAVKYYSPYCSEDEVINKLLSGEIYIGQPILKTCDVLSIDADGRYHVRGSGLE